MNLLGRNVYVYFLSYLAAPVMAESEVVGTVSGGQNVTPSTKGRQNGLNAGRMESATFRQIRHSRWFVPSTCLMD